MSRLYPKTIGRGRTSFKRVIPEQRIERMVRLVWTMEGLDETTLDYEEGLRQLVRLATEPGPVKPMGPEHANWKSAACGTVKGYRSHIKNKEAICKQCREFYSRKRKQWVPRQLSQD